MSCLQLVLLLAHWAALGCMSIAHRSVLHLHKMGAALLHQFATYHIGVCGLAGVSTFIHTALSVYGTECFQLQTHMHS